MVPEIYHPWNTMGDHIVRFNLTKVLGVILTALLAVLISLFVRQPLSPNRFRCTMVPWKVYRFCHEPQTVTSELAQNSAQCPMKTFHTLYSGHNHIPHSREYTPEESESATASDFEEKDAIEKARACGYWGSAEPSQLFLQIYHDALCSLDRKPESAVVSPPLMGSHGVVPLTIVGSLPDLCRHLANCIVRAEHEVFLATNFWIHSDASTLVTNAIRELSRRAGERGRKVMMKVIYDRGDPRQVMDDHLNVHEDQYTSEKVNLPAAHEIPNVDLQVINYHRPIFGTFHAKFTVVDRRIALLQSSNIQDNDNLEMLTHIEGPIVDSFYDAALLSWGKPLDPPLSLMNSPAASNPIPCKEYQPKDTCPDNVPEQLAEHSIVSPHYDTDFEQEARRVNHSIQPRGEETRTQAVTRHLNTTIQTETTGDAPESDQEPPMTPYVVSPAHEPCAMALVNREPYGAPNHSSVHTPQNSAFLSAIQHAQHSILIQTPNMNAEPLLDPLLETVRRGVVVSCYLCLGYNDAGELLPFQNGTNEMIANRLYNSLASEEEKSRLRIYYYVGKDQTEPIHNKFKRRSCHIKLMIIDAAVAIQGNGNLDTQSFFHSQEINVLLDSPLICRTWIDVINRNQNTVKYGGACTKDGCWHHPETDEIPHGSIGIDPGRFSWAKGIVGAVQRVRGAGGF